MNYGKIRKASRFIPVAGRGETGQNEITKHKKGDDTKTEGNHIALMQMVICISYLRESSLATMRRRTDDACKHASEKPAKRVSSG